jgi:hypothetical protein
MVNNSKIFLILLLPFLLFNACDGGKMPEKNISFSKINNVDEKTWDSLAGKRIFFGHQSVGFNIINGIRDLAEENSQIRLNIVKTRQRSAFSAPIFAHSWIGENTHPQSKILAFADLLEKGIGDKIDIAFFKFCYVDVTDKTDILGIFAEYKNTLSHLEKKYPETTFIHVTVPVMSKPSGIEAWAKKSKNFIKIIIGRPVFSYNDNIKREQFNDMIREEYQGRGTIFDLARIESTFPDGRPSSFTRAGKSYYSMVESYTYDGGHLNEMGRKIVAEELLLLLTALSDT